MLRRSPLFAAALSLWLLALPAAGGDYRRSSSIPIQSCRHVDSLAWSGDGHLLVATVRGAPAQPDADEPATLRAWRDGVARYSVRLAPGLYQAAFSPDGALLALADRSDRQSGIVLLDPATGAASATLDTAWPIAAFAFTPDSTHVVASPIGPQTGLWLWDVRTRRRETRPLDARLGNYQQSLDFVPGGLLAISYAGANVGFWDLRTGQLRRRLSARDGIASDVMGGPAAGSREGKWLALAYTPLPPEPTFLPYNWSVRIWDLGGTAPPATVKLPQDPDLLAFRPGTALLAVQLFGLNGSVVLFEPGSWKQRQSLPWSGTLDTMAFAPDGALALAGPAAGKSCRVEIWRDR